ncbi:MAG: family 78 glycoside hydrolase catalytic domain [Gemmiger sp.]|nr:family 78 glycoside hydrolase catalytic domain [Gemmiger sp.]
MMDLAQHFITVNHPEYKEGTVEVFAQKIEPIAIESIAKATLTITALGVYEAALNGKKVGTDFLAPGYTYYPHDLRCQTYDVTAQLAASRAAELRVYLGQGWYCGRFTCDNKTQIYGTQPAVSWVLAVENKDGGSQAFASDDANVQTLPSPYEYAGLYDGEIYYAAGAPREALATAEAAKADSRQSAPGTVLPPVKFTGHIPENLCPTTIPITLHEEMPVQSATKNGEATILDFGQNFAGIIELDPAKLPAGAVVTLRHGEILNADGSLYTANLRKAKAEIIYHKGTETQKYRPRFTYMGFRYLELTGCDYADGLLTAYAIHSEMQRTGHFTSENKSIERLYQNQLWGQKSNYVDVPTDCPQRDERMGYPGDGQVYALTGAYNYDTAAFWEKFLQDIRYSQQDNTEGYVAPTIPAQGPAGVGFLNMLGWGNCVTIVPEMLYWQYGDAEPLRRQYDSMKAHVECEIRHMGGLLGKKDLWIAPNLGDWLSPGKDVKYMAMHNGPVSNAFILNDLRILAWAAARFGKTEDAARYNAQLEKSRAAYLKAFVKADGSMKDDYQGAYIMALKHAIPRGALWDKTFNKLVGKLKAEGIQTGFFATEHLLPLLAENGQAAVAYDLLLQTNCPGWMYQVARGATTIWERWDSLRPDGTVNESKMSDDNMVSFNHYAFGSVGEFYYRYILGIQPLEPGYAKVRIAPVVDARLGSVAGSYLSRNGEIKVSWKAENGDVTVNITTPTVAEILWPDGATQKVAPGSYAHTCKQCL